MKNKTKDILIILTNFSYEKNIPIAKDIEKV